jgi:CubicO group peptidase (beta-lactamase class C family)
MRSAAAREKHQAQMKIVPSSVKCCGHFSVLWLALSLVANGLAPTHSVKLDSLITDLAARKQFSGSILVAEHGREIYERGFGLADERRHVPFTPDTPVYLASLTKQFTAMAVMMLAERGKLSCDDALSKYFPQFPEYAERITVTHLLNHTSGIPDYVELGLERPGLTDQDVLNALVKLPRLRFTPGERFEYSNSGYVLLALIVEKVSGQPYEKFLSEHIFRPLGMTHTFVYTPRESKVARAHGYNRFGDDSDYDLLTYGEGGIYSSVSDMFKWVRALYTEKLVTQTALARAFTAGKLNDGSATNYGFGWGITSMNGEPIYSHAGRYGGFNTYIKLFPKERSAIIFLTNHDFKDMGVIGNAIISVLHDQPYTLPKLSVGEAVYRTYKKRGLTAAIRQCQALKQTLNGDYDFSESELNELGYELLAQNRTADAIEILKLNVEAFPASSNVYDGLGEAYMKNGNKDLAIKNYKRSLELNPDNSNAVKMLKKLVRP